MGTITKALNLLSNFSDRTPELGLGELVKLMGQDKATLHRHLTELEANGFLEQNIQTRKYRLGGAILRLASVREQTFPSRKIVSEHVHTLSSELGELVHASLVQRREMSPLVYHDAGIRGTRVHFSVAEMLPLHATASGHAALAFSPDHLLQSVLASDLRRFTDRTIITAGELEKSIARAKANGFADTSETFEKEVSSVAVPFFESSPYAYGTIAIAVPSSRMTAANKELFIPALKNAAIEITKELGGQLPKDLENTWQLAA